MIEQPQKAPNVRSIEIGLARDLAFAVAPLAQVPDLLDQLELAMLAPGDVLDQAHQHAVLFAGLDDDRRNLVLPERLVGFETTLTADQIVPLLAVGSAPGGHRDRSLETEAGNVGDDIAKDTLVALARVGDVHLSDRGHAHRLRVRHQAATGRPTRSAMPKK